MSKKRSSGAYRKFSKEHVLFLTLFVLIVFILFNGITKCSSSDIGFIRCVNKCTKKYVFFSKLPPPPPPQKYLFFQFFQDHTKDIFFYSSKLSIKKHFFQALEHKYFWTDRTCPKGGHRCGHEDSRGFYFGC